MSDDDYCPWASIGEGGVEDGGLCPLPPTNFQGGEHNITNVPSPPPPDFEGLYDYSLKLRTLFSSPEPKAQVSYCRPFSSVGASSVNFLHFHLLLENAWLDFNQTWQESSLGVGDSNSMYGPHGGPGGGPKGPKHANFQTSSSPDPEGE